MVSNGRMSVDYNLKVMVDVAALWPVLKFYPNTTQREDRNYQRSRPDSRESNWALLQDKPIAATFEIYTKYRDRQTDRTYRQ
jgi:hypothetical protein